MEIWCSVISETGRCVANCHYLNKKSYYFKILHLILYFCHCVTVRCFSEMIKNLLQFYSTDTILIAYNFFMIFYAQHKSFCSNCLLYSPHPR
jgi:hypothetical protein